MNNKEITAIIDMTQEAVEALYLGNSKKFLEKLHKDVVFMGESEESYVVGAEELSYHVNNYLPKIVDKTIKNQKFKCVHCSKNAAVITGLYTVLYAMDGEVMGSDERATFVWSYGSKEWKLVHIHLSLPNKSEGYEEGSNALIYKQKFDLQKIIVNGKNQNKNRIVIKDVDGNRHFISEDEIIFVEADNMNCAVYCLADTFTIRLTLKEIQDMLSSENFVRVHKSYIINKHYVVDIARYTLTTIKGMSVPVSKEKYMEFKELFAESIEKNKIWI